jgi:hypothetical protein
MGHGPLLLSLHSVTQSLARVLLYVSRGRRFGPVLSFDHSEFCIVNMQSVRGRASGLACAGAHCDQLDVAAGEPTIIVREGEGVAVNLRSSGP